MVRQRFIRTGVARGDFVAVTGVSDAIPADPWDEPPSSPILDQTVRSWIASPVYDRLQAGHAHFLAEFRPVVAEFVSFGQIDYEHAGAGPALDARLCRTEDIATRNGGTVFVVSMGDKGGYLLIVFGAPVAHGDDVRRAVATANELRRQPTARSGSASTAAACTPVCTPARCGRRTRSRATSSMSPHG